MAIRGASRIGPSLRKEKLWYVAKAPSIKTTLASTTSNKEWRNTLGFASQTIQLSCRYLRDAELMIFDKYRASIMKASPWNQGMLSLDDPKTDKNAYSHGINSANSISPVQVLLTLPPSCAR